MQDRKDKKKIYIYFLIKLYHFSISHPEMAVMMLFGKVNCCLNITNNIPFCQIVKFVNTILAHLPKSYF